DLDILSELRLELDPAVEAPRQLGPLIDPEFHSCGSVQPHGERMLAHPEPGFYIVGMKSYGRAPTFLMATGYEQVRSIAAALPGASTPDPVATCDAPPPAPPATTDQGCCTPATAAPVLLPTPVATCC